MIETWIRRYFPAERVSEALAVLDAYWAEKWHNEPDRVKRDAIIVSRGSLEGLKAAIDLARNDYRDVLVGEEVDPWLIAELRRWGEGR